MCTIAIKGMLYSVTAIKFNETGEALLLAPIQYNVDVFVKKYYGDANLIPLEELDFDKITVEKLVDDIHQSSDRFRAGRGYLCEEEDGGWVRSRQPYMPHWCGK